MQLGLRRAASSPASPRRARRLRAAVAPTRPSSDTPRRPVSTTAPQVLRSFRLDDAQLKENKQEIPTYNLGDKVTVEIFAPGDQVKVTGTSKGRGFQGVVKRYGFHGGPNTHGNTKHRRPGSIGPGTDPSRVIKGKKMPGHYGDQRHTQTHLRIEQHRCRAQPDLHPRFGRRSHERHRPREEAGLING